MPLGILLTLVVGGIAGLAILMHLLGLSRAKRFDTPESARAAFLREYPDATVMRVALCASGRGALLRTDRGLALVWAMGADSAARLLSAGQLRLTGTGAEARTGDFTAPRIRLPLNPEDRAAWTALLKDP